MHPILRVAFAGTPCFAANILEALLDRQQQGSAGYEIVAVLTAPDRQAGRGMRLKKTEVKQFCERFDGNLPVLQPADRNDVDVPRQLRALNLDVLLVTAYGLILPGSWLELPRYGCINAHASLLPRWRGAAPIERAIMAGDELTGISIMQMDESVDGGAVLLRESCAIEAEDSAASLEHKLQPMAVRALGTVLEALSLKRSAALEPIPQSHGQAVLAPKIKKHEQFLDWQQDAGSLHRLVRALDQRGYACMRIEDNTSVLLKVVSAQSKTYNGQATPGTILTVDEEGILVACATDALLLKSLQVPGKRQAQNIVNLRNGYTDWFAPGGALSIGAVIR
jgi:methionyl-tRNA formyltransferase